MDRCPKDEPAKKLPIPEKNWKNLFGGGGGMDPPAIGGLSTIMKNGESFIQQSCFRLERGQEKSACRVSFMLVLQVKIAVIQSLKKADSGGASLKFANFRHFVPI